MKASLPATAPKSKRTLYIILGLVGLGLLVSGVMYRSSHATPPQAITVEKSEVRTITQVVTATGKIQPETEVKISSEVFGEIIELPFREGAKVKKGDLLVKLKPDLYQTQVDQQSAAVESAKATLVRAKAKFDQSTSDLKRYEDLFHRNLASDSEYVQYKTNHEMAKADFLAATANVRQVQGVLGQMQNQLSKTVIYSPMDGIISARASEIGERVVATGSFTGTEMMRVADLTNMEVQVNVNENDVPNVKLGDHAVLSIDAYPDRKFSGFVKEIASSSEGSAASGSGSSAQASGASADQVTNFLVKIRVADRDIQLKPGMSATADIETQTASNVIAVPIQSVTVRAEGGLTTEEVQKNELKAAQDKSGNDLAVSSDKENAKRMRNALQRVVFVKVGDVVKMKQVVTGIADNTWIEVKSGVAANEEIVSGTYAAISRKLKDGMKVIIEAPKKDKN
ncbi:MAG: efflux RND transporter periplasmic adaptor subunit [Verrucomicrobiota bacterium]